MVNELDTEPGVSSGFRILLSYFSFHAPTHISSRATRNKVDKSREVVQRLITKRGRVNERNRETCSGFEKKVGGKKK